MSESVELRFRYTEAEYVSAIRAYMLAKSRVAIFVGIASLLTLLGIYFLFTQPDSGIHIFFMLTGIVMFALVATSFGILPHRRFRANPQFRSEYHLHFAEDGILFQTDHIDSRLEWDLYKEAIETKACYLLCYGEGALTVIPKRTFNSDDDETRFREMVTRKVDNLDDE
jgi:hypothetical protein